MESPTRYPAPGSDAPGAPPPLSRALTDADGLVPVAAPEPSTPARPRSSVRRTHLAAIALAVTATAAWWLCQTKSARRIHGSTRENP